MDYIISHNNLDFDGLSSMAAAKCLYQDALMVLPANQERSVRNFLTLYRHFAQALKEKYVRQETITRIIVLDTQDPDKTGIFKDYF
jgi:tRNA nucleotidyltransferase (CCA-adding enzyme)